MNVMRLRHFDALFRLRNFARAADEQGITQSALSRSLQKLEDELGTRLFDRNTHQVSPTAAGDRLIGAARDAIAAAALLSEEARAIDRPVTGVVRVGSGPYPMQTLVAPAVAAFARALPGVGVAVEGGRSSGLLDALVSRGLDLVVCDISKFDNSAYADQVVVLPLPSEPLVIVCRHDHPVADGAAPKDFPWAIPRPAPGSTARMSAALRARTAAEVFPDFAVDSTSACIDIVREGVAISVLPASLAETFDLHRRPMPGGERTNDGIHMLKGRSRGAAVRRFIEILRAEAASRAG